MYAGKVKSALTYPIFVIIVAVIVIAIIMGYAVPVFTTVFTGHGSLIFRYRPDC